MDEKVELGTCCSCGKASADVRNILLLPRRGTEGKGWGCFVCGLPNDGASAVLCDECLETGAEIKYAIVGYAHENERIPVSELTERFEHDMAAHRYVDISVDEAVEYADAGCSHGETMAFVSPVTGRIDLGCMDCGDYIAHWDGSGDAPDWVPLALRNFKVDSDDG